MESGHIQAGSTFQLTVLQPDAGQRIDKYTTEHFQQYSRSFLKKLFDQKQVIVNNSKLVKPSYVLVAGDQVSITFPEVSTTKVAKEIPNDLAIKVIAKEKDFLIINKPAGLVVHPPSTRYENITLSDWIVQTHEEIAHVGLIDRPGIVHRLDKETSGLMIIPRTSHAHATFTDMFKNREIKKTYLAIVANHPEKNGVINFYIDRHPTVRNKMHHFTEKTKRTSSRHATTYFQTLEYFKDFSLIQAMPVTGRTHQIRVHCAALGHPIIGDSVYGNKSKTINRHALHAHKLEFTYQDTFYSFTSELEADMQNIINQAHLSDSK